MGGFRRHIAEFAIDADPDDAHGVWGSDLMALVTLTGDNPDWPLVERIRATLDALWSPITRDEPSG
jgi:hypothetical protein